MALSHVFSSPIADHTGTVTVFNSAGVTVTANATEIVRPSNWNSVHNEFLTLSGNTAGASTMSGTNLVFQGGNNVTLSANGATLVFSGGAGGGGMGISAGTQSVSTGTMIFADSNGLTFGMSGSSQITGSYTQSTHSHATAAFSGSNGSFTANTVTFGNLNGLSFYTSNGSMVGSHNALTTAAASDHSHGNPTLNLTNLSGTTASNSAGFTLSLSAAAMLGGGVAIAGGGQTQTVGTVNFTNANGITFGLDSVLGSMTASHNALTSQSNQAFSAGAASSAFQTLSFQDSNGVSFSNNAGALRVTHALQFTSATSAITSNALHSSASRVINIVAATNNTGGGTASLSSNVSFSAANGITFYTSAGSAIVGSVVTSYRASNDAIGTNTAQTNVTWTANSAGLSVNAAGYAGTTTAVTGAAVITLNSLGLRFDGVGLAGTSTGFTGANISGSMTHNSAGLAMSLSVAAPGGGGGSQSIGMSTQTAGGATAGTAGYASGSAILMHFAPGSNITMSQSVNGASATLSIFAPAPGAAVEANPVNLLGANTAGNTTATGSTLGFSGVNLTLSGTNASQIVFSAPATSSLSALANITIGTTGSTIGFSVGAAGGGVTIPGLHPYDDLVQVLGQVGQGSMIIDPQPMPNFVFDRVGLMLQNTNSSNSSGSHTLSFWVGLYTRNVSTLSLYYSMSGSTALTHSGTAGSYSWYSGKRLLPLTVAQTTITENRYWIAVVSRTTSGGANGTYSNYVVSNLNTNFTGIFGQASNATMQPRLGQGIYTATTSGMPNSIAFSQINGTNSLGIRMPVIGFGSGTA